MEGEDKQKADGTSRLLSVYNLLINYCLLIFRCVAHNVERSALGFIVETTNVFSKNAQGNQLHPTEEKHRDQCRCLTKERLGSRDSHVHYKRDGNNGNPCGNKTKE